MQMIVIGGRGRVGKTTLANQLAKKGFEAGFRPVILPFAQPLKDAAAVAGFTKEDNPDGYRQYCQVEGTKARDEDPDYWVNEWTMQVNEILISEYTQLEGALAEEVPFFETLIICDDCRYSNEVEQARHMQALTVFVRHNDRELDEADANWRDHISETLANECEADPDTYRGFDLIIHNDQDGEGLANVADLIVTQFLGFEGLISEETNHSDS